ncbi:hypothetical protein MTO96_039418 [Rhipicephalus appendiculatus]
MRLLVLATTALSFLATCGNAQSSRGASFAGSAGAGTASVGGGYGGAGNFARSSGGSSQYAGNSHGNYGGPFKRRFCWILRLRRRKCSLHLYYE